MSSSHLVSHKLLVFLCYLLIFKFSKLQMQKSLFEEYKLTAAEILYELEEILQKYAVYNITFPVGIVNLVDYSWHDLTADAYKYATKNPMLKKHRAFQDDTSIMTMIDLKDTKSTAAQEKNIIRGTAW